MGMADIVRGHLQVPMSLMYLCPETPYKSFTFHSFKLHLSFYLSFIVLQLSHQLCSIRHFNHLLFCSLIILVPCVPTHHSSSLHVISFVPCYFLHSFPLNVARDILCVSFTPISVVMATPYISNSVYIVIIFVFSSLACN